jgi:hypothetical protein
LDDCAVWIAINTRDKSQDTRKSQKIIKLEKLRQTHDCFLNPEVILTADQLVTLLERFESQDERSHCAFVSTFTVKAEQETRQNDIWLEAGLDLAIADLCSNIMLAYDMRHEVVEHRNAAAELDQSATQHLSEAKRIMRLDRKEQDGDTVYQHLSSAMLGKDPVAEQTEIAHQKLNAAINTCARIDDFCVNIDTILANALTTCPDEGKDVIRAGAQRAANDIRQNMDACQKVVEELDAISAHTGKVFSEAEHYSATFVAPMTHEERQKKMMERKSQADQAYLERMKKKARPSLGFADKK